MVYARQYLSPIGALTVVTDGEAVLELRTDGAAVAGSAHDNAPMTEAFRWLDIYFGGQAPRFTPPIKLTGTPFAREVHELLLDIPYGHTVSYGALAKILAARRNVPRMSAQAVGGAVGRNRIAIIVPCHRVIGADGSLTGYAGGIDIKKKLLAIEGVKISE